MKNSRGYEIDINSKNYLLPKWKILKDMVRGVDVVLEIVDARDIPGTRLPIAEKISGSKKLLVIANKKDLLAQNAPRIKLENKGIYFSATRATGGDRINLIELILSKTENRPAKALLIGYPNVGKSSLVNFLSKRSPAKVSPVAGTTRNIQWIKVQPDLIISDYRGIHKDKEEKLNLAIKGALNVSETKEVDDYAVKFAEKILKSHILRKWLEKKYDIDLSKANYYEEVVSAIARRRGFFVKGGELNLKEAAKHLVRAMREAPEI